MANPKDIVVGTGGLVTNPNELTLINGELAVADNVVINRERMPERRRGFMDDSLNIPDFQPEQLWSDASQTQLYMHLDNGIWYRNEETGDWFRKASVSDSGFSGLRHLVVVADIAYIVTDQHVLYSLDLVTGRKTILVGRYGTAGTTSGTGTGARLNSPISICYGQNGSLYILEPNAVRQVVIATLVVSSLAGSSGNPGTSDGTGLLARFNAGGAVDQSGTIAFDGTYLWVTDSRNHTVRRVTLGGTVTTPYGAAGVSGATNANGTLARFSSPNGLAVDGLGLMYVYDSNGFRKIDTGTTAVTTLGIGAVTIGGYLALLDGNLWSTNPAPFTPDVHAYSLTPYLPVAGTSIGGLVNIAVDGINDISSVSVDMTGLAVWGDNLLLSDNDTLRKIYPNLTNSLGSPTYTTYIASLAGASSIWGVFGVSTIAPPDLVPNKVQAGALFSGPDGCRVKTAEFNGNSYICSSAGIVKSEYPAAYLKFAGVPQSLDLTLSLSATSPTLMVTASAAAYRTVWGYRDYNNNVIYGAPSQRTVITNTSGATRNVQIVSIIPDEINTNYFLQVYRTEIITPDTVDPGDSCALVFEYTLTSADITAGTITHIDKQPDEMRGDALYTNEDQEGIINANNRPPLAKTICLFKDHMFYGNFKDRQRMTIQFVGNSGFTNGVSTLNIGGVVFTANAAAVVATGTFLNYTASTVAVNVETTARSFVAVVNGYAANQQYYAYYSSGTLDIPGLVTIEERGIGGLPFVVYANTTTTGSMFSPVIPTNAVVNAYTSVADTRPNRIRASKYQQPEAAPLVNDVIVGAQDDEIMSIHAARESLIVIKERSVWRVTGNDIFSFTATILDDTVSIAGRDSAAKLNNAVYFLSNQGFVAATDNGVQIVGRPIENKTSAMMAKRNAPDNTIFVAGSNEAQRLYYCSGWDPVDNIGMAYVYNAISRSWTTWHLYANCWATASDRIYYGIAGATGHVMKQRDELRDADTINFAMADDEGTFVITSINIANSTATGTWTELVNYDGYQYSAFYGGWSIYSDGMHFLVTSVTAGVATIANDIEYLSTGTKPIYRAIPITIETEPRIAGNPSELKQYGDVLMKFESLRAGEITFSAMTEQDYKTYPFSYNWGIPVSSWDVVVVGDENVFRPYNSLRTAVVDTRSRGEQISIRVYNRTAGARFALKSLIIETRPTGSVKSGT